MSRKFVSLEDIEAFLQEKMPHRKVRRTCITKETKRFFQIGTFFENENMLFNLSLGEELILKLYNSYMEKENMFNTVRAETHAPQYIFIPGYEHDIIDLNHFLPGITPWEPTHTPLVRGSAGYILWLFFATLTDRRQKSGGPYGVYASHCRIYADRPELYTEYVTTLDEKEFGLYLRKFKIGVPNQSAEYWIRCAKTLFNDFGGDPVRMFSEIGSDVHSVQKFKDNTKKTSTDALPGYGPKITSLYSLFLHEIDAVRMPLDAFPVDVQVQRVFIQSCAIKKKGDISNAMMEKVLRQFICLIAKHYDLDKVVVSHSFWLLGSELCNGCPSRQNAPVMCPIYSMCNGCENTASYFAKGKWQVIDVPMNKGGQESKVFGMPGVTPQRYTRKKREASPQLHLFNSNVETSS